MFLRLYNVIKYFEYFLKLDIKIRKLYIDKFFIVCYNKGSEKITRKF